MNKPLKILLSVLAGIDVTINIFTPIILVAIWISLAGTDSVLDLLFFGLGLLATIFRAIKIGWLKNGR